MLKRKNIPLDCVFEGTGLVGASSNSDVPAATESETAPSQSLGVLLQSSGSADSRIEEFRWKIDYRTSLEELKKLLGIDATPPSLLAGLPTASSAAPHLKPVADAAGASLVGSHLSVKWMQRTSAEATELLDASESLRQRLGVTQCSPSTFAAQVQQLYEKVIWLRPGYAEELRARVDAAVQLNARVANEPTIPSSSVAAQTDRSDASPTTVPLIGTEHVKDVMPLVNFLNDDVAPNIYAVLEAASQFRTLAPILRHAVNRANFLLVLLDDPMVVASQVDRMLDEVSHFESSLAESEKACVESVEALLERHKKVQQRRASSSIKRKTFQ